MMKSVKALLAALSAVAAGAVALGGNLEKLSQFSFTGPVYTLLQVARPELFFLLLLFVAIAVLGKTYATFGADLHTALQQRKWLVSRLRGTIAASCALLVVLLSFTVYEGYYYAKGKMFAWTNKGRSVLAVADRHFTSGRYESAKTLLEFCSKTLDSTSCKLALDDLTARRNAELSIDRLLNIVPFSPGIHRALLMDRLQVSYDIGTYDNQKGKLVDKVKALNQRYQSGLEQVRRSDFANALSTLETVNAESPGYRDAHRFVEELRRAGKQKKLTAPFDGKAFPYLAAATTLSAGDLVSALQLGDLSLPTAEEVLRLDDAVDEFE